MNPQKNLKVGRCKYLADSAVKALIKEVFLTPKPGLVDFLQQGSHKDLSYGLMVESANSLYPCFLEMAEVSYGELVSTSLRKKLSEIGIAGENKMKQVTKGVNTHKGAIWIIGLFVASTAMLDMNKRKSAQDILDTAGSLAKVPLEFCTDLITNGSHASQTYGVIGARGEAEACFPNISKVGLPAFHKIFKKIGVKRIGYLQCLLYIMQSLDDTCVLHRSGIDGLSYVKQTAHEIIELGGYETTEGIRQINIFNKNLIGKNITSGGAADLLAGIIYLTELEMEGNIKWRN